MKRNPIISNRSKKILLRSIIGFAFPLICFLLGSCNKTVLKSTYVRSPYTVDGDLHDWDGTPFTIFDENKVALAAANDSLFFYFAGRCTDPVKIQSIARQGITLWIDPSCRQQTDLELHYPASQYASVNQSRGGFWDALTDNQRERAMKELKELQNGILIVDKQGIDTRIFKRDSTDSFSAALNISKGMLSFEIRIPLNLTKYFSHFESLTQREKIALGVGRSKNLNEWSPDSGPYDTRSSAGSMGTGPRGFLPIRESQSKDSDLWVEVALAKP